jgi:DNA-binding CsgD family transcriptional regulator
VSFTYDASIPAAFRIRTFVSDGLSDQAASHLLEGIPRSDANHVRRSFLSLSCGTSSEVPGWHEQKGVDTAARDFGIRDTLTINGVNPDGHGCALIGLLSQELRLDLRRRNVLAKIACHLAAAYRLRQSLAAAQHPAGAPVAILSPEGTVHHAEGEASSNAALALLRRSAVSITGARGPLRDREPEQAVDEWKGLIAARWTLVDVCEKGGTKYLVARQNRPRTRGPNSLTDREQEVVAFAALGHHNKLIAYNLGISDSTVRVLVARAAKKLGARSRDELVQRLQ